MDYKVNIFLRMSWIDKRLQFEVNVVKCILWSVYSLNLKRGINYLSIFCWLRVILCRSTTEICEHHWTFTLQCTKCFGFRIWFSRMRRKAASTRSLPTIDYWSCKRVAKSTRRSEFHSHSAATWTSKSFRWTCKHVRCSWNPSEIQSNRCDSSGRRKMQFSWITILSCLSLK